MSKKPSMILSSRLTAQAVEMRYVGSIYWIDHNIYIVEPGKRPRLIGRHVAEAEQWLVKHKAG